MLVAAAGHCWLATGTTLCHGAFCNVAGIGDAGEQGEVPRQEVSTVCGSGDGAVCYQCVSSLGLGSCQKGVDHSCISW